LQNRPGDTLVGHLSLLLSYSLCLMRLDTKGRGSPRQSCQDLTLPLSLTPATSNPQPASSRRPGEP
jgi:hypothetical protein